mmetsp:Transcript_36083/g.84585  ORF Transcript_36083/g.84585 Transcript_36083/m.84585 type:complete len:663 (-) Transcript_36083:96-2084(-)
MPEAARNEFRRKGHARTALLRPELPAPLSDSQKVEVATLTEVPTADALAKWLKDRGLDTSDWGSGDTKDVAKFWKEIKLDESGLEVWKSPQGELRPVRVTHVLRAKVCSPASYERGVFLFNTWQQYGDGRKRTRNGLLSEKLTISEMPLEDNLHEVCERAVTEEEMQRVVESARVIGPDSPAPAYDPKYQCPLKVVDEHFVEHTVEIEKSKSYPGLLTMYHLYTVDIICEGLPSVDFNTLEFEHAEKGEVPKLKYIHAWVWLEWSQIQRYLFEGSTMKERKTKGSFSSPDHLRKWLEQFDLDLQSWGTGNYRSVKSLYDEMESQQTQLELWGRQDGVPLLMRVVHLLQLKVTSSDVRQASKFLILVWQQSKEGRTRHVNRLLAKKLSIADLPIDEAKLVKAAKEAVNEQLPHIVDAHFQMQGSKVPSITDVEKLRIEMKRMEIQDHTHDLEESTTYKRLQTMYHLYTVEVECNGLPLADFTSIDFARAGGPYANSWRWITWPETMNTLHGRAFQFERQLEIQKRTMQDIRKERLMQVLEAVTRASSSLGKDDPDVAEAQKLITEVQGELERLEKDDPLCLAKALPPSMVSKMAEQTIVSEELLVGRVISMSAPVIASERSEGKRRSQALPNGFSVVDGDANGNCPGKRSSGWLSCCSHPLKS